ncbi:cilia- and flagella-associated protein 300 [Brienomyrus brachyistius]|uniref:cilia- and flagella-associated protein 300 n=1 Tax=Brienomyrus brachyistius TaxID=42636 RepID=UPI0020B40481|nr:cilia- and flagella-associated protein 300 [Brienomyrus brachyistius]
MAVREQALKQQFTFSLLPSKVFAFTQDRHTTEFFMKWSMLGRISAQTFKFDQLFHPYRRHDFVSDFFRDPNVISNLKVIGPLGLWEPFEKDIASLNVEIIPCTKVSMDIFDPLYNSGILHPNGHIVKCFHEHYTNFDELKKMLLIEDSENYGIISLENRVEFLFRLFKHICLGGELCQHEDVISPYIETTRLIYKDLISVRKDPDTKEITVVSTVLKVTACDHFGLCYPSRSGEEQNFAYLIVDPLKRHVHVLYHSFGVGLFNT